MTKRTKKVGGTLFSETLFLEISGVVDRQRWERLEDFVIVDLETDIFLNSYR